MNVDGACHCGEIAYEAEIDPERVGICHCTDCQTLSATAYRTVCMVPGDKFRLTKGTPKEYVKVAESGNARAQGFCGNCGSAIYATNAGDDRPVYSLRVGTLRQRAELAPTFECWHGSALPWLPENPATRKMDGNPVLP